MFGVGKTGNNNNGRMTKRPRENPSGDIPSLGERLVTALISAIGVALTLVCYGVIMLVLGAKSPSGPPGWIADLFMSPTAALIICLGALLGFALGAEPMAKIFAVLWGTSSLWQEAWFYRMGAIVLVGATLVMMVTHLGS